MFFVRKYFRLYFMDVEFFCNRLCCISIIAGEHDNFDALFVEIFDRSYCVLLDRITHGNYCCGQAVNGLQGQPHWPFFCKGFATSDVSCVEIPNFSKSRALPIRIILSWTFPLTPSPVRDSKSLTSRTSAPRVLAPRTIASAKGCSLERSSDDANDKTSFSVKSLNVFNFR